MINGARPARSEVKLRGRLSLEFPRKSFTVKLGESVVLRRGASERTLKRFYLSALATDRGYFRAAVCLDLLRRLKRFPLYTTFAEVRINGRSFGPYLLIERPVDALLKRGRAVLVVRRRQNRLDDGPVLAPKRTDLTGRDVLDRWDALLARVAQARGAVKRRALERGLDLPGLLTWVAFDLLVHNADAGQAWVVAHPRGRADVRFDLLPWDYDQAFAERVERDWPHPWMFRDRMPETELRREPVFAAYRARLRELAAWIEGPETRAVFEAVFRELAPYYAAPEVIANARRDRGGAVDLTALQAMMQREYAALVRRARSVRGR